MSTFAKNAPADTCPLGTGASVAVAFGKLGYSVALLARKSESLHPVEEAIKRAGGNAASFHTDISDEKSVKLAFEDVAKKLPGAIEVAIFNASSPFVGTLKIASWIFQLTPLPLQMKKPFLELATENIENSFKVSA